MPPKRKYNNVKSKRITSWLRSTRSRTAAARPAARRFTARSRLRKRSSRRVGGRGKRSGGRYKGTSSFQRLTRILAPVSSFSFQVAGRAQVVTGAATGILGISPCEWFTPMRAGDVSLAYPNWLDVNAISTSLNDLSVAQSLTSTIYGIESLDFKFITRDYKQVTKMVNQSNAQCVVHYHVLEARRDIPHHSGTGLPSAYNILNYLGQGFFTTAVMSASNAGFSATAPAVTAGAADTNTALNDSAFNIFQSGPFLHYFKVKETRKVIMNAGDIKQFHLNHSGAITNRPALYNRMQFQSGTWAYGSNDPVYAFLKGTKFQIFKLVGTPFNSAANKDLVNTTQPAVDFVTTCSLKYQAINRVGGIQHRGPNYNLGAFTDGQFMGEQQELPLTALNA